MELLKFYRDVLGTIHLEEKDGFIYVDDANDPKKKKIKKVDDKPLVMPLKSYVERPNDVVNGKMQAKYHFFNPLWEDRTNGESPSFDMTQNAIVEKMNYLSIAVVLMLIEVMLEPREDLSIDIQGFISGLSRINLQNVKKLVDKGNTGTSARFVKLTSHDLNKMVKITLKKQVEKHDTKFNRGFVLSFPLLDNLKDLRNRKESGEIKSKDKLLLNGVELRQKDLHVYIYILEFIFDKYLNDNIVAISDNESTASLSVLLKGYNEFFQDMSKVLSKVVGEKEVSDLMEIGEIKITYDLDILDELDLLSDQAKIVFMASSGRSQKIKPEKKKRETNYEEPPFDVNEPSVRIEDETDISSILSGLNKSEREPDPYEENYTRSSRRSDRRERGRRDGREKRRRSREENRKHREPERRERYNGSDILNRLGGR